jgi:hypothetical protein
VRLAAAAIGGAGAALGALVYPLAIVLWVAVLVLSGFFPSVTLVDAAFVGPLVAASLSCVAGAAGAWLVFAGRTRSAVRRGALLMLAAALVVVVVLVAQPFLVDAAGDRGLTERIGNDSEPSLAEQPLVLLAPTGALLVGAALALLSPGRHYGAVNRDSGA